MILSLWAQNFSLAPVLVISCCITNYLTASVGQEPGCSPAGSGSLTSAGKVLARTVSSQDSVGRICFQAHSCACRRPRVLTGCWPKMVISFPCGLFHRGTQNMAVGFPQSEISEREGWGRGKKDYDNRSHSLCNPILDVTPSQLSGLLSPVHTQGRELCRV